MHPKWETNPAIMNFIMIPLYPNNDPGLMMPQSTLVKRQCRPLTEDSLTRTLEVTMVIAITRPARIKMIKICEPVARMDSALPELPINEINNTNTRKIPIMGIITMLRVPLGAKKALEWCWMLELE
jgi:hypothetical protein